MITAANPEWMHPLQRHRHSRAHRFFCRPIQMRRISNHAGSAMLFLPVVSGCAWSHTTSAGTAPLHMSGQLQLPGSTDVARGPTWRPRRMATAMPTYVRTFSPAGPRVGPNPPLRGLRSDQGYPLRTTGTTSEPGLFRLPLCSPRASSFRANGEPGVPLLPQVHYVISHSK